MPFNDGKRESGYYWIKLGEFKDDPVTENGWEVAYYKRGEGWYSIWEGGDYQDGQVADIDEKRLMRE